MQLIGWLDSPYVRRVAITMQYLGIKYDHRQLSIFYEYDEFRRINPLVKVPTLVFDDDTIMVDSTLIIDHLESISKDRTLIPTKPSQCRASLQHTGVALVAMEKTVQLIYELKKRPAETRDEDWKKRLLEQLESACELMEKTVTGLDSWLFGSQISHADVTIAVAWRFGQHIFPEFIEESRFPGLVNFSERAEKLPEFIACPLS